MPFVFQFSSPQCLSGVKEGSQLNFFSRVSTVTTRCRTQVVPGCCLNRRVACRENEDVGTASECPPNIDDPEGIKILGTLGSDEFVSQATGSWLEKAMFYLGQSCLGQFLLRPGSTYAKFYSGQILFFRFRPFSGVVVVLLLLLLLLPKP